MHRLIRLLALALIGSLCAVGSPVHAVEGTVNPPGTYLRGNLGIYTTTTHVRLRLDWGGVDLPEAEGDEELSWDVQLLRTDMRTPTRPEWGTTLTGVTVRRHTFAIGSGRILCVRARQHSWGVTSAWSPRTCVVRARDDSDLRREGPVDVVADWRYADDRASVLLPRTRMFVRRVPDGALYGPVYTDRGIRPDGTVCTHPSWKIAGHGEPNSANGVRGDGALLLLFHHTRVAGKAVMWSPLGRTCPVGGFVVVPRWVPR